MISRAFIPPWSFVTTKPETLGPDTSSKEAGTLVSRYNLLKNSFTHLIHKHNKKLYLWICAPNTPKQPPNTHEHGLCVHHLARIINTCHAVFLRATTTPSRVGFMKASNSESLKISLLCSRMASVQPGTMST